MLNSKTKPVQPNVRAGKVNSVEETTDVSLVPAQQVMSDVSNRSGGKNSLENVQSESLFSSQRTSSCVNKEIIHINFMRRDDERVTNEYVDWHSFRCLGDSLMCKFLKHIVDFWYEKDGAKPLLQHRIRPKEFLHQPQLRDVQTPESVSYTHLTLPTIYSV